MASPPAEQHVSPVRRVIKTVGAQRGQGEVERLARSRRVRGEHESLLAEAIRALHPLSLQVASFGGKEPLLRLRSAGVRLALCRSCRIRAFAARSADSCASFSDARSSPLSFLSFRPLCCTCVVKVSFAAPQLRRLTCLLAALELGERRSHVLVQLLRRCGGSGRLRLPCSWLSHLR